ncbi:MAG: 6-carboxy-5,6,7,8-tetrahydropterin synthase [Ignavibacteriaceae bacterium]|nr:MAG: 6-carboxytetrahydropterin synthase [Chlorobiota bacterium]GJQ31367.1 MAG: 6-carboxy-5,6,7,8-tetrahydropterin synthase [Ignavibacteriaceae bacterium]
MKISKSFHWEMGHRLPYHPGKCVNLHGHSYRLFLEVEGEIDENGLVIDFYDLKKVVNPIIEELDHAFMVSSLDPKLNDLLEGFSTKRVDVDFHSTVENITKYLLDRIADNVLPANITAVTATVYETQDAYARETRVIRK